MKAYFCQQTGNRIAGPGVSKRVDPGHGKDEVVEEKGKLKVVHVPRPETTAEKDEPKAHDSAKAAPAGADKKPAKGGE